ncbi:MAG: hypothetical protein IT249_01350 [Chitinophagaceae bacterium]|nr:hypothetical protein [Chitinophagaceae bacterium]
MKYTPLLLLFFSLIVISCKKDKLTKETQNGANTFSCLIDGQIFKPAKSEGLLFNNDPVLYGGLSISNDYSIASITAAYKASYPQKYITIEIDHFHGVGEYLLNNENNIITYTEYTTAIPFVVNYSSLHTLSGKVAITKDDRANTILSGTFEFTATSPDDPGRIITVTSGRFDLNYKK